MRLPFTRSLHERVKELEDEVASLRTGASNRTTWHERREQDVERLGRRVVQLGDALAASTGRPVPWDDETRESA